MTRCKRTGPGGNSFRCRGALSRMGEGTPERKREIQTAGGRCRKRNGRIRRDKLWDVWGMLLGLGATDAGKRPEPTRGSLTT